MLLFPIIPLLAINQTSCEKGMPWWGYLLYVPLLLRAKWVEYKIMRTLNEDLEPKQSKTCMKSRKSD